MSDHALIATRKGLFSLRRRDTRWDLDLIGFPGDPVNLVLAGPGGSRIHAALDLGHFGVKLHRGEDGGTTWTEVGVPAYPDEGVDAQGQKRGKSLRLIWALAGGAGPDELWAGTLPGGLFHSADGGATWRLNESLWHRPEREQWFGGGYDDPGIHSVCVDPLDPNRIAVGVSCGGVWWSDDGGASWEVRTRGMYAEYMPEDRREDPVIQDPHRVVQSPSHPDVFWAQHHNGIFRTTNRGADWEDLSPRARPASFGFAVAVHPTDPDTAWFVPAVADQCRIPVDGQFVVSRTRDGGATFEVLREGLPQEHAYDLVFRHALDVDETGERLVLGSTTGNLWVSENGGDAFRHVSAHLPPVYAVLWVK